MVRTLVLFSESSRQLGAVALKVSEGSKRAGADCELVSYAGLASFPQGVDSFDLVFLGYDATRVFGGDREFEKFAASHVSQGRMVALFGVCASRRGSKERFKSAASLVEGKQADVRNTLTLTLKGNLAFLGRGGLDEVDFARAEAFGERTTNYFSGRRVHPFSEKTRIAGYRK